MADITFVGFLSGVNPQVSFQLERIWRSVGTMGTLIRAFAGVTPDVTLQFAQFNTGVIALGTFMRFFKCMTVAHVSHKLTGRGERAFTVFTVMWFGSGVSVNVIL